MACHILHRESSCITTLQSTVLIQKILQLDGPDSCEPCKGIIMFMFDVMAHTHTHDTARHSKHLFLLGTDIRTLQDLGTCAPSDWFLACMISLFG